MRSDQLTGDQLEALSAKFRPMLRYLHKLRDRMDHEFDPQDPLRLATVSAAAATQSLLSELHLLSCDPGTVGKPVRPPKNIMPTNDDPLGRKPRK